MTLATYKEMTGQIREHTASAEHIIASPSRAKHIQQTAVEIFFVYA